MCSGHTPLKLFCTCFAQPDQSPTEQDDRTPGRLQAVWPPPKTKDTEEKVGLKYTEAGNVKGTWHPGTNLFLQWLLVQVQRTLRSGGLVSLHIVTQKASSVFATGIKAHHFAHLLRVNLLGLKGDCSWVNERGHTCQVGEPLGSGMEQVDYKFFWKQVVNAHIMFVWTGSISRGGECDSPGL